MPFILPPKATSWAQPLDVGCFQPLKHYHTEAIDSAVRMGDDEFNRLDFLDCIHVIREQAFKTTTIKSAFRKTGLIPWNPNVFLDPMRQRNDRARQVTPPPPTPTGPLLERTPSKPRELIAFGLSIIDKFDNIDWMHDDFKAIVARHVRAASVSARTVQILQRDLFKVHKSAKRKTNHKAVGSSVAQKSGSMTAGMIRESYQAKRVNEVKASELRLERAKRGVIIRAEKRITSNRKWLKDYDKALWKDLSDQKARWTQWFICLEAIELEDYKLYPPVLDSEDDD